MAFQFTQIKNVGLNHSNSPAVFTYNTTDTIATVLSPGYFSDARLEFQLNDVIHANCNGKLYYLNVSSTPNDIDDVVGIALIENENVPMISNGKFSRSCVFDRENSNVLEVNKTLQVQAETVNVGTNLAIGDRGGFLSGKAQAFDNKDFLFPNSLVYVGQAEYSASVPGDGVKRARKPVIWPGWWQNPAFNSTSEVFSGTRMAFPYVTSNDLFVETLRFHSAGTSANVRIQIQRLFTGDGSNENDWATVWESHNDTQLTVLKSAYSVSPGVFEIEAPLINFGRKNEIFRGILETTEATGVPLYGQTINIGLGSAFYPKVYFYGRDWQTISMADYYDVNPESAFRYQSPLLFNTSAQPTYRQLATSETVVNEQTIFADTIANANGEEMDFDAPGNVLMTSFTIKAVNSKADVLFTLRDLDNDTAFDKPIFIKTDIAAGDNELSFATEEARLIAGDRFRIDIRAFDGTDSDTPLQLLGNGNDPYFTYKYKNTTDYTVANEESMEVRTVTSNSTAYNLNRISVDTTGGSVTISVDANAKTFYVFDAKEKFSVNNCIVDFGGGLTATLNVLRDHFCFFLNGSTWRYLNMSNGKSGDV